jgi:hypothetical protein
MPKSFIRNFEHNGNYLVPHTIIAIMWARLTTENQQLWWQIDEYEKNI